VHHSARVITISREEARSYLLGQLGLRQVVHRNPLELLQALRCIQLDPLDAIGTNVDLVAFARVDGLLRGDVFRAVYPGHAFEHWAKERCLLPASAFSMYRHHAAEAPWWRHEERLNRLPQGLIDEVLHEIGERGPLTPSQLTDRGNVAPLDWGGWKGTAKAHSMAIEVLWTRCDIVVCGREGNTKLYDVPERALGVASRGSRPARGRASQVAKDFQRWAVLERVEAAGLLSRASGSTWSMLSEARTARIPEQLIAEGLLEEVAIEGSSRPYLAPAGFRRRTFPPSDGRIRILGPLDPLLWDRPLVKYVFDFDYVWEVYKPASQRRWGWYVCPLLQGDRLVGRLEGVVDRALRIRKVWWERDARMDNDALDQALAWHATSCGVTRVVRPRVR
jgi:uncharacterized protein YcaQ